MHRYTCICIHTYVHIHTHKHMNTYSKYMERGLAKEISDHISDDQQTFVTNHGASYAHTATQYNALQQQIMRHQMHSLQHTATTNNEAPHAHTATQYNTLQQRIMRHQMHTLQGVQHTATHCNTLQHTATPNHAN